MNRWPDTNGQYSGYCNGSFTVEFSIVNWGDDYMQISIKEFSFCDENNYPCWSCRSDNGAQWVDENDIDPVSTWAQDLEVVGASGRPMRSNAYRTDCRNLRVSEYSGGWVAKSDILSLIRYKSLEATQHSTNSRNRTLFIPNPWLPRILHNFSITTKPLNSNHLFPYCNHFQCNYCHSNPTISNDNCMRNTYFL